MNEINSVHSQIGAPLPDNVSCIIQFNKDVLRYRAVLSSGENIIPVKRSVKIEDKIK
jgi:hypothetical protein